MSSKHVRFLAVSFGIYIALSIAINMLFGPPGMSAEYLAEYKADHDRYLSISKSAEYKLHHENEALNPPANDAQAADFAFADEYASREDFEKEMRRRERYEQLFDFLRAGMVLLVAVWFGSKPIAGYLDSQIAHVRERLDRAAEERRAADTRDANARAKLNEIDAERARLIDEAKERVAAEHARMEETSAQALGMLAQEREDRVRNEELLARRVLKKALVEEAIEILVEQYQSGRTPESEARLVDDFVKQMETVR